MDFVVTERRHPVLLVEAKLRDASVDRSLRYLRRKFPQADAVQIAAEGIKAHVGPDAIRVRPASDFLAELV